MNVFQQRGARGGLPRHPARDPDAGGARPAGRSASSAERPRGLVLVTGPTGSGKSTTLAAMIDHINETDAGPHHHASRTRSSSCTSTRSAHRQPARGRRSDTHQLRRSAQARAAPGPRRDPGRRDARPRDHLARASPPPRPATSSSARCTRSERRPDHRPHHRRVPPAPAAAGAHAALESLQGVLSPDAAAQATAGGRIAALEIMLGNAGRRQPDPRGQDPPDPVAAAGRRGRTACRRARPRSWTS